MNGLQTAFLAIILFMLLVTLHEFGHFIVAKLSGIKVNEFSVGMGPKLIQKQKGETKYSLRALPLGGYCAMEGEGEDSDDPRSFQQSKPLKKFLTILAGPLTNILLAIILLSIAAGLSTTATTTIKTVTESSPAKLAGLKSGDKLLSIAEKEINSYDQVSEYIQISKGKEVNAVIERNGNKETIKITPKLEDGRYIIGIYPKEVPFEGNPLAKGFEDTVKIFKALSGFLGRLFTGELGLNDLSGPVGVVTEISKASSYGIRYLIWFFGYISLNLAFFNLLPIPALDGSQLIYIIIEKIRGKRLKTETIAKINTVGFVLLMGLILVVSIKDIVKLF